MKYDKHHMIMIKIFFFIYCKRRYFRAAKFSRIKPEEAYLRGLIFAHIPFNSTCSIMIIIFIHIKFSRIYSPARNARKYVLYLQYSFLFSIHFYLFIFCLSYFFFFSILCTVNLKPTSNQLISVRAWLSLKDSEFVQSYNIHISLW